MSLRRLLCDHRYLALCLVLIALCTKMLVPAGYMIGTSGKTLSVEICGDASGGKLTKQISIAIADKVGNAGKSADDRNGHGKGETVCPYSALSLTSLSGADLLLLALALAFILALGFMLLAPRPIRRAQYLVPPLRGPPTLA